MKFKNIWTSVIIFYTIIILLCACGKQQQDTPDKLYLGITCYNQSDTFINQLVTCLKDKLSQFENDNFEVTMTIRDAAGSQRTQDDQVQELINAGCNILCVNLVDRADPSEIINLAKENNVPIIFFNREPVAEDMMRWEMLYYVGADAKQSGIMQGELALSAIQANKNIDRNKDGKIQYAVLEGEPGHQDAIIRTENAVDTLKNNGIELEKLCCGIANWNRAQAQNRMMHIISQHQNNIELVLANNDAYKKLNYTDSALPVFFGIDGTDVGLNAVKDLELAGTVYNDKEGQAAAIAKLAVEIISKKEITNKYTYLPYSKVTSDNVNDFLDKDK